MNAKKVKNLRRIARRMNAGGDTRHYGSSDGRQAVLTSCERATYRQLKNMVASR